MSLYDQLFSFLPASNLVKLIDTFRVDDISKFDPFADISPEHVLSFSKMLHGNNSALSFKVD